MKINQYNVSEIYSAVVSLYINDKSKSLLQHYDLWNDEKGIAYPSIDKQAVIKVFNI